jgi:hypothetical protein
MGSRPTPSRVETEFARATIATARRYVEVVAGLLA